MHIQPRPFTIPKKNESNADIVKKAPPRAIIEEPTIIEPIRIPYTDNPWASTASGLSPTALIESPNGVRLKIHQTKPTIRIASQVIAVC